MLINQGVGINWSFIKVIINDVFNVFENLTIVFKW